MINKERIKKDARKAALYCLSDETMATTAWTTLDYNMYGKRFVIVFGYMDGFEESEKDMYGKDGTRLCCKLAYQETGVIYLLNEYEMDWLMPMVPGSAVDVWDTEISLWEGCDIDEIVDWLLDEYEAYCNAVEELSEMAS